MAWGIMIYTSVRDTYCGKLFCKHIDSYQNGPKDNAIKRSGNNVAIRFRLGLTAIPALLAMITDFALGLIIGVGDLLIGRFVPLAYHAKKFTVFGISNGYTACVCLKGALAGPSFVAHIPQDALNCEEGYLNNKKFKFSRLFNDQDQNIQTIRGLMEAFNQLCTLSKRRLIGSIRYEVDHPEFSITHFEFIDRIEKTYRELFRFATQLREGYVV